MNLKSAYHVEGSKSTQLTKGAVFQINKDNQSRLSWKLGIVTDIRHGRDGKVRASTLRLPAVTFIRRAVQHLYRLEFDNYRWMKNLPSIYTDPNVFK